MVRILDYLELKRTPGFALISLFFTIFALPIKQFTRPKILFKKETKGMKHYILY